MILRRTGVYRIQSIQYNIGKKTDSALPRSLYGKKSEYGGSGPLRFAKPQSCKASLALHASKLQSLKAAKPLWRLTPQSLKAPKPLWRLAPQSLKAAKPLWRLTLQSLKASKPERLDALALWRLFQALALLGAFPTPQSLKA